jgi:hypothetical protein
MDFTFLESNFPMILCMFVWVLSKLPSEHEAVLEYALRFLPISAIICSIELTQWHVKCIDNKFIQYIWCILLTMLPPTCFGRFSGHIQGEVIIMRIRNVHMWLCPSHHIEVDLIVIYVFWI